MGALKSFVAQKMSRRFVLWFSITLSFPIFGLLFFTISSLNDREELLKRQVQENQLGRVLQAEKLYLNQFYKGYVQAIQALFVKVNRDKIDLVTRKLDPQDPISTGKLVSEYTNYFYSDMLPYLGVKVDPLSANREALQRESFVIMHLMEIRYAEQEFQDFYDAIALSSINGHQESKYEGKAKVHSREMKSVYRSFTDAHYERRKWVPSRSFPSYREAHKKDVLRGFTRIRSNAVFKVFKKFPKLMKLADDALIEGKELDEIRESIADLLRYRFQVLGIIVDLRRKFYQIKNEINSLRKQTVKILGKERTDRKLPESIDDFKSYLNTVIEELESVKLKNSTVLAHLTSYRDLRAINESMLVSLDSCKNLILQHFNMPEKLFDSDNFPTVLPEV
mgnify:CR=1 FL=1